MGRTARGRFRLPPLLLALLLALAGCAPEGSGAACAVVFEDNEALFFTRQVYQVPRGGDVEVEVGVPTGERVASVNYGRYTLSAKLRSSQSYDYYTLILHEVRYPLLIRLTTAPLRSITYHAGAGTGEDLTVQDPGVHLRANTLPWRGQFSRPGHTAVGWNTAPDGSGTHIGFGSRAGHGGETSLDLYVEWLPQTPAEHFTYRLTEGGAVITGCDLSGGDLVLPDALGGAPVTAIAAGAFGDVAAETVVLPPTLERVEEGAFRSLTAEDLYLFDALTEVGDSSFGLCQIARLHVNAVLDPVYSGSYFDTYPDKADYLRSLREEPKLILFCGSSARFGYDSPMLEAAFPEFRVVNMGVYAYSNMRPQAEILLQFVREGDILLSSPELDAIQAQFCGETALDRETFCLVESDFDLLTLLDCRGYTGIFDAFGAFQAARADMEPRSYSESPSFYDEDGARQSQSTYNSYGDYILYRENNLSGENFGVKRAFYNAAHIRPQDWAGLNQVYDAFAARGVEVFFTYSPRSRTSLSPDSTEEAIAQLDALFRSQLHAAVISSIGDSLMDPLYFYATDNHLSTEGVQIHTAQVIEDLRRARGGAA